jgi:ABC-type dipeptide/oligopeptide/nickel transport system permease subunit
VLDSAQQSTGLRRDRLVARRSLGASVWKTVRRSPLGALGLALILVLVFVGVFAPLIAPYGVNEFAGLSNEAPNSTFWFGTDKFGQDLYSRVIHGARISLQVSFVSVLCGTAIGLLVGSFSGFKGGWLDTAIQRVVDTAIAFPALILLLMIVRLLEPSLQNVIIVIAIVIIPGVARVIRGAALAERNNQYIEAATALGATDMRILMRHVIPNMLPLAIVISTTLLGTAILAEASLSFLGLGVPPPNPSWGADISAARTSFPINIAQAVFPGLAITLTVLGFNLLGDGLRDVLDPRLRGS